MKKIFSDQLMNGVAMRGIFRAFVVLCAFALTLCAFNSVGLAAPYVRYQVHVRGIGWMDTVESGETAGTEGQSRQIEAIRISAGRGDSGHIEYSAHVQGIGWQDWRYSGEIAGTTGQNKRMEAIKIRLLGSYADRYDVLYRVHVSGSGWSDWAQNGEVAGTTGQGRQMEAIQIELVDRSGHHRRHRDRW